MLKFISIQNFAIIDKLEIEFGTGLNLITGETGSGKSILVDAVGMLAGSRAQQEMIRQGSSAAVVEGIFQPEKDHKCWGMLKEAGIEVKEGEIIVRREISNSGNNRSYINSRLVPLATVVELGGMLIDIHGQHAQQDLLMPNSHLRFLDQYAGNKQLLDEYGTEYQAFKILEKRLEHLEESERDRLQRLDLLNFQIREIEQLDLHPEKDGLLEEERVLLANAEFRKIESGAAYDLLYEADQSAISLLDQALQNIEQLQEVDPTLEDLHEKLLDLRYRTEEICYSIRDYNDSVQVDPQRLEMVEDRLNEIEKLKRKYGSDIPEILNYFNQISSEVVAIKESEIQDRQLQEDLRQRSEACAQLSSRLSAVREKASSKLIRDIERELGELAMKNVKFAVEIKRDTQPGPDGHDQVEFLISTNRGERPRPLAKIASGGELSRIMLALRTVLKSKKVTKSLVFDEVDAGIGGKTASILGEKLARLAVNQQVFCVTHLPQVAAYGKNHYHAGKKVVNNRTIATIRVLDQEERVEELSRLLGGHTVSEITRKQAREMLRSGINPAASDSKEGRVENID